MKIIITFILLSLSLQLVAQSFDIYNGDTINITDTHNKKQGLWITFNNKGDQIVESGYYQNGKKDSTWLAYYPSGQKKHEITYTLGHPKGKASFYFENGSIREKGYWDVDHWQGSYQLYHATGQIAYDWNYNEEGKRTGVQKYYHENGTLKYQGEWNNGKTTGALKVYNEEGQLISERVYADGKFNKSVAHDPTKSLPPKKTTPSERSVFKGTGMHTVYHLSGKPERKGFFVKGKLFNGEHLLYDQDGNLIKKVVYENGQIVRTEDLKKP